MIPDPRKVTVTYDPAEKKKYKVGYLRKPMIVTEIKRPEPAAVLVLESESEVELSNEEIRTLLHQEAGPLIPRDLLTPADAAPEGGTDEGEQAKKGGSKGGKKKGGKKPEGDPANEAAADEAGNENQGEKPQE